MRLTAKLWIVIVLIISACNPLASATVSDIKLTFVALPTSIPLSESDDDVLELWWILTGDGGNNGLPAGCGDSVALRPSNVPANLSIDETIERGLAYLTDDDNIGDGRIASGWWNPMSTVSLTMDSYDITNGHVTAYLSGDFSTGGVCSFTQFEPQVALNIMTLTKTKSATIYINGGNYRQSNDMSAQDTRTGYTWEEFQRQFIEFWIISTENSHPKAIQLGCDRYIIPRKTIIFPTGDTLTDLNTAFMGLMLFNPDTTQDENLAENYLNPQGLFIENITLENSHATVNIGGDYQPVGNCLDSIIERQIIQTIFQFEEIQSATILNGDMNFRQFVDTSDRPEIVDYIYTRPN